MNEITKEWLLSALMDLRSIEKIIDDEFLTPVASFHAQQCVEKSLKAILESDGSEVPKIHDVIKLYGLVRKHHDVVFDFSLLQKVGELYIEARYPGELGLLPEGKPTLDDARSFYHFAKGVYERVTAYLEANSQLDTMAT